MFLASHAQVSSNRYVHFASGRAHGTCATSTPWSGHCTRGAADSRNVRVVPVSTVRHRLVPTPASYPGHDRRHCAHLLADRASGRTDTTRTSPSPSGSGCMVTSPMTMPWTPINCPNTLVLRMPCLLRRSGPLARPKTTGRRGRSPQTATSGTHNNVTRARRYLPHADRIVTVRTVLVQAHPLVVVCAPWRTPSEKPTPGTRPNAPDHTPRHGQPRPATRTPATTTDYPSKN